jgi:hypothetical protein
LLTIDEERSLRALYHTPVLGSLIEVARHGFRSVE